MYIWLETTFGTVQKWSLRPLLDSPKGGLNIGILLYIHFSGDRTNKKHWKLLAYIWTIRTLPHLGTKAAIEIP